MRRRQILDNLQTALKSIDTSTDTNALFHRQPYTFQTNVFNNVFDKYKFIDEINDFPSICIYNVTDSVVHIGSDVKYGSLSINIRGYVRSSDAIIPECEKLIDDIEYVVNNFRYTQAGRDNCVVDCRVITLETDEGLFEPFGVINVEVSMAYERE